MLSLDRSKFSKTVHLVAANVLPRSIPVFQRHCARDVLKQARLRSVFDRDGLKLIALRPEITLEDRSCLHPDSAAYIEQEKIPLLPLKLDLDYDYWQAEDILAAILPEDLVEDSPAGFTMVGHIAHMNLREEYLPYKNIIGQVILDKNSAIRTVVNKLDTIDSVYRSFQMEVLAGDHDLIAEQYESGCKFRFDFSKVFWNSRLHTEHGRLIALFKPGDAVCDVMAGVGPFAIPAAKRNVIVFANDLNPDSYKALLDNVSLNRVSSFVRASNQDGRQFIRDSLKELRSFNEQSETNALTVKRPPRKKVKNSESASGNTQTSITVPRTFQHYIMNLPASAIEFLDAFSGLYTGMPNDTPLPTVHVHCFTKFENDAATSDMTDRISTALACKVPQNDIHFHHVRRVAPNKDMFCCSFTLPGVVAFRASVVAGKGDIEE